MGWKWSMTSNYPNKRQLEGVYKWYDKESSCNCTAAFLFEKNLQENVNLIMEVWRVLYEISHSYQDAI